MLAERWPDGADLESVAIQEEGPERIVVTVWTTRPGELIGRQGSGASALREALRTAVPDRSVELRVRAMASAFGVAPEPPLGATAPARDLVPDLVGMTVGEAHAKAASSGFSLRTADPDGVPITFSMARHQYGHWVVMGQSPLPWVPAPLHSIISVAIEERGGGGESGDREPRVPGPPGGIVQLERLIELEELEYVEDIDGVTLRPPATS